MVGEVTFEQLSEWVADLCRPARDADDARQKVRTVTRVRGWLDVIQADLAHVAAGRTGGGPDGSGTGPGADDGSGQEDAAGSGEGGGAGSGAGASGGAPDPEWMRQHGKMTAAEAARAARRAAVLSEVPAWRHALTDGEVGVAHVDAYARSLARVTATVRARLVAEAAALVLVASGTTPEKFERHLEATVRRWQAESDTLTQFERQRKAANLRLWKDPITGMWNGRFSLDPEWGKKVFNALQRETDLLWSEQEASRDEPADVVLAHLGAKALVTLLQQGRAAKGAPSEVMVHIDWRTLCDGPHANSLCELDDGTPIPVSTAQRLCCGATFLPVLIGGEGEVLKLGREVRLANRAQRRALRAMYRTCVYEGCSVEFDRCEIHHVLVWERLGLTDLENLVPICWRHHHLVHEGGWTMSIAPDRTITFRSPWGGERVLRLADHARWRPGAFEDGATSPPGTAPPGTSPPGTAPPGTGAPPGRPPGEGTAADETRLFDVVA